MKKIESFVGKFVSSAAYGFPRLREQYDRDPYHKFDIGDVLVLKGKTYDYGIRPVARIEDYQLREGIWQYSALMSRDAVFEGLFPGDFTLWLAHNVVPEDATREESIDWYNKWNFEATFKRVLKGTTLVGAINLYRSRSVPRGIYEDMLPRGK